ncbi:hypothetical protein KL905_002508 [Ogataea polymorpha]|nr:hypothetical protein KL937_002096 [Ogataea polymorpha]KAG7889331.1 hypothetical protein KL936_002905 [Ogataea polymorpha]KAG7894635.1 hypothetical protein KL908_002007 [Ogataea polymorpha]KAG7899772.1 hypothetical protein KL935_003313 [Ogataea polymorpha]KAG7906612.1 hypothetical protein KL907_002252 [Ogataea polymorpha]
MFSLFRPLVQFSFPQLTRGLAKTHRATYKRWRKTGTGYKRGLQGRKHGNAGHPHSILKRRTGITYANHIQEKQLKRLMPYL